jgi:anti-sigma B factor antagonist
MTGPPHTGREPPVQGVERREGAAVVRLAGELDLHTAEEVRETLLELADELPSRLVLDFAAVDFVDSTVLGVLVETRSRLRPHGRLLLVAPGLETARALEISGLDRHLPVHASVDDALAAP